MFVQFRIIPTNYNYQMFINRDLNEQILVLLLINRYNIVNNRFTKKNQHQFVHGHITMVGRYCTYFDYPALMFSVVVTALFKLIRTDRSS